MNFKNYTREEFVEILERNSWGWCREKIESPCPSCVGLEEDGCSIANCKECWLKAIENVKFKGENKMTQLFEKGKKYRIKTWNELLKYANVCEDKECGLECVDDTVHYNIKMDRIKNRIIEIEENCKEMSIRDECVGRTWVIRPWMCEEVKLDESLEDRMKKLGFELSSGESYDELIDMLINKLSKKETTKREENSQTTKEISSTKVDKHIKICMDLNNLYEAKNHDYGDNFGETYRKLGLVSAVTRITDKVNRLQSLATQEQKVKDESVKDTLMDLANYCIMTLIELGNKKEVN